MKLINIKYFLTLSFLIMSHSAHASIESLTQECIEKGSFYITENRYPSPDYLNISCTKDTESSFPLINLVASRLGPEMEKHQDTKRIDTGRGEYKLTLKTDKFNYTCLYETQGVDGFKTCYIRTDSNQLKSILAKSLNSQD